MPVIISPYSYARSLNYIGKCTSTGAALNFGSLDAGTIAAGDLLIYMQAGRSGSTPAHVTPSGFTDGNIDTSALERIILSAKIAAGSEGSVTGMDAAVDKKVGLVFRPNNWTIGSFTFNDMQGTVVNGDPAAKSSAAGSAASYPVLVFGHMGTMDASTISGKSVIPSMNELAGPDAGYFAHYLIYPSSAADLTTYDKGDDGSGNFLQCGYLTFT